MDLLQQLVSGSQTSHLFLCPYMTTWLSSGNAASPAIHYGAKENPLVFLANRFLLEDDTDCIVSWCSHISVRGRKYVPF